MSVGGQRKVDTICCRGVERQRRRGQHLPIIPFPGPEVECSIPESQAVQHVTGVAEEFL